MCAQMLVFTLSPYVGHSAVIPNTVVLPESLLAGLRFPPVEQKFVTDGRRRRSGGDAGARSDSGSFGA